MNNEIKEILAYFEKYVKTTYMHDSEPMINWKDLKIVLDYITNLENENKKLKNHKYNVKPTFTKRKIETLQSRNEKAVEYIRHEWFKREQLGIAGLNFSYEELQKILDILQGKSDDNE